jgi:2-haloalkanoic acid dehalogenase type II
MIKEPSVVVLDYYETLTELSMPMREKVFDEIAESVGARLQSGEAFRNWHEEIVPDSAVRLAGTERPDPDGPVPPFVSFRATWLRRFEELFRHWGVVAPAEIGASAYGDAHASAEVYPDVDPALAALRNRFRLGLLADADRGYLDQGLAVNQLEFDVVVASEDVGAYKPHNSMFRTVCERLGVSPLQAVYVGDRPWADIEGARHAGLEPVWINRGDATWPDDMDPPSSVVASISDLVDLLA